MSPAVRIIVVQAGIGTLCSVAFFLSGRSAGTSAVLAALCVLLPSTYYALVQARTLGAARILLHGVLKMMLTVVLMALSIILIGIEPLAFFLTLALMQVSYLTGGGAKAKKGELKRKGD